MEHREISRATIGRLPGYLDFIQKLPKHIRYISATAISKALGLGEVQVRKDLSAVCGSGRPKIGYEVDTLCEALEYALGIHAECEAVIVGAGRLGMALLGFKGFAEYGITIEKAFDSNKEKCGGPVLPLEKLPEYCARHRVEIGILTVPSECAQEVAEWLVSCGVKAIWCFAAARLTVPENVMVCYENLALSLAHLRQKMKISGMK